MINQIEFIDSNAFYNLSNLISLNLNSNKLKQLQMSNLLFIKLKYLQIENNEFESIVKVNNSLNLNDGL